MHSVRVWPLLLLRLAIIGRTLELFVTATSAQNLTRKSRFWRSIVCIAERSFRRFSHPLPNRLNYLNHLNHRPTVLPATIGSRLFGDPIGPKMRPHHILASNFSFSRFCTSFALFCISSLTIRSQTTHFVAISVFYVYFVFFIFLFSHFSFFRPKLLPALICFVNFFDFFFDFSRFMITAQTCAIIILPFVSVLVFLVVSASSSSSFDFTASSICSCTRVRRIILLHHRSALPFIFLFFFFFFRVLCHIRSVRCRTLLDRSRTRPVRFHPHTISS